MDLERCTTQQRARGCPINVMLSIEEFEALAIKVRGSGMSRREYVLAAILAYEAPSKIDDRVEALERRVAELERR